MSKFSIVCCIEAGRLEYETCLMLATWRQFGGDFSDAECFVVRGRSGTEISDASRAFIREMGANYVFAPEYNPAPWFNYSNKICAVRFLQEAAGTEYLVWLDSDVLIAGNPFRHIGDGIDFAGRCEYLPPAVHYGNGTHIPYWEKISRLLGCNYDEIPWFDLDFPRARLKLFFNSGIFVWRKSSGFASNYCAAFEKILKSRYATRDGSAWYADQVCLSPIVIGNGYRWQHLDIQDHPLFEVAVR
ncbi:MAG: hypothetical protein H6R10_2320 [Rhodocyclaceae bacterium]|nr:hypothetical protein [Rhodocyclaceae bacterium]